MTRADAVRNRESVLRASAEVLAEDPNATMQTIARVSGVGRTTLYRHFPSRPLLLEELAALAVADARAAFESVVDTAWAGSQATAEVLSQLGTAFLLIGQRWRGLDRQPDLRENDPFRRRESTEPLLAWLGALRDRGELDPQLPTEWCYLMMYSMAAAAHDEVQAGRSDLSDAGALLGRSYARLLCTSG